MKVGESIKNARVTLNLTQLQLAERIGVKHNTVSDWENGRTSPNPEQINLLCETLKISADILLGTVYVNEQLSKSEQQHIKKYRDLDSHGKTMVDFVLDEEARRIQDAQATYKKETMNADNLIYIDFKRSWQPASAGKGIHLGPEYMETVKARASALPESSCFGVPVSGDSMEPCYHNGDTLVVSKEPVDIGQIGVFTMGGEGYVKKLGQGVLQSLNHEYDDIPLTEDIRCCGKVVGVLGPEDIKV